MREAVLQVDTNWQQSKQDQQFFRINVLFFVIAIAFAGFVLKIELPPQTRAEQEKLPAQLLKIVERKKIEKPVIPEQKPVKEELPEEQELVKKKDEVKTKPVSEEKIAKAKKKAKKSGLLALSAELQDMHQSADLTAFSSMQEKPAIEGDGSVPAQSTSLSDMALASNNLSGAGSAGNGSIARELDVISVAGGLSQSQRKTIKKTSSLGGAADQAGTYAANSEHMNENSAEFSDSDEGQERSTESIRQVFDKNKGALFAIYRRALRQDPSLEGKVMIEIVIMPDGSVSLVKMLLSELDFVELEDKLLARIKMIHFGEVGNKETKLKYTFNFLPF